MGVLNRGTAGYLTLGCRVNQYETEAIAEALAELGFRQTPFGEICDLYVINTCAVTEESVRKSRQMVRRAVKRNPGAFVAVCGCASQLAPAVFAAIPGVSFVCGSRNKAEIVAAVGAWAGNGMPAPSGAVLSVGEPAGNPEPLRVTSFDRTRAYVKIEDGCDGSCAYCVIPSVRGPVALRPEEEILSEISALAAGGCREVVLTGIETAAYGPALVPLITRAAEIPGIRRIRMGSLEPSFLKPPLIDALAAIPAVCPHFHLSVQNGSDRILRRMRRKYNTAMLTASVDAVRARLPEAEFSADIIVGFPGETEADFAETCALIERIGFLHLHLFPYSRRPGTEAADMPDQIPEAVKADRLRRLTVLGEAEKEKRLAKKLRAAAPLTVLAETPAGRASNGRERILGHTDSFIECRVTLPAGYDAGAARGRFFSFLPDKIEDGLLCGDVLSGRPDGSPD